MASKTQNVKMGVCQISFGGVDLGYTKGGVEVIVATESKAVMVDQFGNAPIDEIVVGRTCKVKVPLAETTLENLVRIMPGATLTSTGSAAASASITFSTAIPANGDKVTINGVDFVFKTVPVGANDVLIAGTFGAQSALLAAVINNSIDPLIEQMLATSVSGVVTLTSRDLASYPNAWTLTKTFVTGANCTVTAFSGGLDATKRKVVVGNAVGVSLLKVALALVIHPSGNAETDRSDDFTIPLANTPGAMQFAYKIDQERIFDCEFQAFPDSANNGRLFIVGDASAT
jgi:hypothetical protein